jgi:hypothetical protein
VFFEVEGKREGVGVAETLVALEEMLGEFQDLLHNFFLQGSLRICGNDLFIF